MSEVILHEITDQMEWTLCKIPHCNKMFNRHPLGHKLYGLSDKLGVCPLCIHDRKMNNGTYVKTRQVIINFHHKSTDSKPMRDSL